MGTSGTKVERYRRDRNDRLDFVLRKIRKHGGTLDGLTAAEHAFLKRVSSELRLEIGLDRPAQK